MVKKMITAKEILESGGFIYENQCREFYEQLEDFVGEREITHRDYFAFLKSLGFDFNEKIQLPLNWPQTRLVWLLTHGFKFDDLTYLNQKYNLGKLLYAASGFDTIPKSVLGVERVVHLSLEGRKGRDSENKDKSTYFEKLGDGTKVVGDSQQMPFAENSFNSIYCNVGFLMKGESLEELIRVTKRKGFLILNPQRDGAVGWALLDKRLNELERLKGYFVFRCQK
ncbi:hypothetical protein HZA97_00300 [Candidatus Woesearchaeota archaeon]|nr:hypothetical protein [Candidatus Woesearchaeota archaeon]